MLENIVIEGGCPIDGVIRVSGSKNAGLPLMLLPLLTDAPCILRGLPLLTDTIMLSKLLRRLGARVLLTERRGGGCDLEICFKNLESSFASYNLVSKMRASFWVIAALVNRSGFARVAMPGGCALGERPIELILQGLRCLGVEISLSGGYIEARTRKGGLQGAKIEFPTISVGATHCSMIAACMAKGSSRIINAACEPEIVSVADCLNSMGAKIEGAGSKIINIEGVDSLSGFDFNVPPDRIEAGSYAILAVATGGKLRLDNVDSGSLSILLTKLAETGAKIIVSKDSLEIERDFKTKLSPVDISTGVYPGFPTDLQAQFMALMTLSDGKSIIKETVFENRFMQIAELRRFGASIEICSHERAIVSGVKSLAAAEVKATDLRASVSLVIAALTAKGVSSIHNIHHLDRGFESLSEKLSACNVNISREGGIFSRRIGHIESVSRRFSVV